MLTQLQIAELKRLLDERERALRARLHAAIAERAGRDQSELAADGGDDSEQSIADLLEEVDLRSLKDEGNELLAIDAARESMKAGTYGTCVICHGPIEYKRLLVLPAAERCLPCQEHLEREQWKGPGSKL